LIGGFIGWIEQSQKEYDGKARSMVCKAVRSAQDPRH